LFAAQYYQRGANHEDPDGANNFGFCPERLVGVQQTIQMADEHDKFAVDQTCSALKLSLIRRIRLFDR
jgi:hypothetical protein